MENETTNTTPETALISAAPSKCYCSVTGNDPTAKAIVYNAVNNPTVKISDHVNQDIFIKDIYCEEIERIDPETGEVQNLKKTVLIDPEGNSFFSVSNGIFRAVQNLIRIFGYPTYTNPVHVKVIAVKLKKGQTYGLQIL